MPGFRQLAAPPLEIGECPVWDARENALWFVDIKAPALFRLNMAGQSLRSFKMPAAIGSFGLCQGHRLIVALRSGVHFFDPLSGALTFIVHPEPDRPDNRLNDGKVSPDGRFFVGSMDDSPAKAATAALHRIDPDGSCTCMLEGLRLSNGLAWSADGSMLMHSDTRHQYVQAFDYDPATGALANRRLVCELSEAQGRPDGAAMDQAGFYWSAGVSAGRLNRIAPNGEIAQCLATPCAAPTMPCFGGPDLKTLFLTSLAKDGAPGGLYAMEVDAPGVPVARFASM